VAYQAGRNRRNMGLAARSDAAELSQ
jgi:hypothetical protein